MAIFWQIVCLAGLWGWVLATVGFILAGFPARGVFAARRAFPWGVAVVVCFFAWVVGMLHA